MVEIGGMQESDVEASIATAVRGVLENLNAELDAKLADKQYGETSAADPSPQPHAGCLATIPSRNRLTSSPMILVGSLLIARYLPCLH